jgi:hypothetical protein
MGGTRGTYGVIGNAYKSLVEKCEKRNTLGRQTYLGI